MPPKPSPARYHPLVPFRLTQALSPLKQLIITRHPLPGSRDPWKQPFRWSPAGGKIALTSFELGSIKTICDCTYACARRGHPDPSAGSGCGGFYFNTHSRECFLLADLSSIAGKITEDTSGHLSYSYRTVRSWKGDLVSECVTPTRNGIDMPPSPAGYELIHAAGTGWVDDELQLDTGPLQLLEQTKVKTVGDCAEACARFVLGAKGPTASCVAHLAPASCLDNASQDCVFDSAAGSFGGCRPRGCEDYDDDRDGCGATDGCKFSRSDNVCHTTGENAPRELPCRSYSHDSCPLKRCRIIPSTAYPIAGLDSEAPAGVCGCMPGNSGFCPEQLPDSKSSPQLDCEGFAYSPSSRVCELIATVARPGSLTPATKGKVYYDTRVLPAKSAGVVLSYSRTQLFPAARASVRCDQFGAEAHDVCGPGGSDGAEPTGAGQYCAAGGGGCRPCYECAMKLDSVTASFGTGDDGCPAWCTSGPPAAVFDAPGDTILWSRAVTPFQRRGGATGIPMVPGCAARSTFIDLSAGSLVASPGEKKQLVDSALATALRNLKLRLKVCEREFLFYC